MKGKNVNRKLTSSKYSWRQALEEVLERLEKHKRQGQMLRDAMRICTEKINAGETWPLNQPHINENANEDARASA